MQIVRLTVPAADAELAADALWQHEPSAVHEEAGPDDTVVLTADVADLASPPLGADQSDGSSADSSSVLGVDQSDGSSAASRSSVVGAAMRAGWVLELIDLADDAHLDTWRAWAQPVRAGTRTVLQPAWLDVDPAVAHGNLVLRIDPGRAFGSGSHVSTRQVLAVIEAIGLAMATVLDVGCGSGVLAVAAARHGARGVLAIDVDEAAIHATMANAAYNGVAVRIEASQTPVGAIGGTFDLVLANIGVRVLVDLAPEIEPRVASGGLLVLAGLLAEQADEAVAAYLGCTELRRDLDEGWACVVLRRT